MPGRGKSSGRKKKGSATQTSGQKAPRNDCEEIERLRVLEPQDVRNLQGNVIHFERIIYKSLALPEIIESKNKESINNNEEKSLDIYEPEKVRYGGDCHVPESIRTN